MVPRAIGHYTLMARLGAGAMGEVFRARDTRLNRDVAVKILPPRFAGDADRLRRFDQETKGLAALNHPNVLIIFDRGICEGAPYLVSELLEGQSLRELLNSSAKTGLPPRLALEYALQIAQGLAAAHGKSIVHRDLKPDNVFVTQSGTVKILDFGLAKLRKTHVAAPANEQAQAASTLVESTSPGLILGTPAYMAPEQIRGEPADPRADIFALGCVLYEMLTGRRPFRAETAADVMSAILGQEPDEFAHDAPGLTLAIEPTVRRCLEKKPERRFQSASDLAFALEQLKVLRSGAQPTARQVEAGWPIGRRALWILVAVPAVLAAGALGFWRAMAPTQQPGQYRVVELKVMNLKATESQPALLSPDGRSLLYLRDDNLWLQSFSDVGEPRMVPGSAGAQYPCWKPDGTAIAFWSADAYWRYEIQGAGGPILLAKGNEVGNGGTAWRRDDRIFVTGDDNPHPGVTVVSSRGGELKPFLRLRTNEFDFHEICLTPDHRYALMVLHEEKKNPEAIVRLDLDTKQRVEILRLPEESIQAPVVSQGFLLFSQASGARGIYGIPYSPDRPLNPEHRRLLVPGSYLPSVSADGVLVCATNAPPLARAILLDRRGEVISRSQPLLEPAMLSISPDGQGVALGLGIQSAAQPTDFPTYEDVWKADRRLEQLERVTRNNRGTGHLPERWVSSDELLVHVLPLDQFYSIKKDGSPGRIARHGGGRPFLSSTGRYVVFNRRTMETKHDLWYLDLRTREERVFESTTDEDACPALSPDEGYVAFESNRDGPLQVWVKKFPDGRAVPFSTRPSSSPHWLNGGKELVFAEDNTNIVSVQVTTDPELRPAHPTLLFHLDSARYAFARSTIARGLRFDVSDDGQTFTALETVMPTNRVGGLLLIEKMKINLKGRYFG